VELGAKYNLFMVTSARGGLTAGVFFWLALLSDFIESESLRVSMNTKRSFDRVKRSLRVLVLFSEG